MEQLEKGIFQKKRKEKKPQLCNMFDHINDSVRNSKQTRPESKLGFVAKKLFSYELFLGRRKQKKKGFIKNALGMFWPMIQQDICNQFFFIKQIEKNVSIDMAQHSQQSVVGWSVMDNRQLTINQKYLQYDLKLTNNNRTSFMNQSSK